MLINRGLAEGRARVCFSCLRTKPFPDYTSRITFSSRNFHFLIFYNVSSTQTSATAFPRPSLPPLPLLYPQRHPASFLTPPVLMLPCTCTCGCSGPLLRAGDDTVSGSLLSRSKCHSGGLTFPMADARAGSLRAGCHPRGLNHKRTLPPFL